MQLAVASSSLHACHEADGGESSSGPNKTHLHSSAELRQLAARWRAEPMGDDAERAERVARTLEWVAQQRDQRRLLQARSWCSRFASWLRR
ncbi:hypothetical protein QTH91_15500 [Variovorax dokdonensis]|uniref:Uncharacterized protein n=1 Tax=Variovorax dokdonensis TaxID=344883 RepID=A0ABT7ND87_9BURK|nr:hypothetical protein [Variovorax dokdonensis]MDM0045893.1 hypothetical protein [Variovorax dokdonensis]